MILFGNLYFYDISNFIIPQLIISLGISKVNYRFILLNFLVFALFALITVSSILPASGQVAYARFRSPIMPFVCIISAVGLVKLKESYLKKKNEVNWRSPVGRPK